MSKTKNDADSSVNRLARLVGIATEYEDELGRLRQEAARQAETIRHLKEANKELKAENTTLRGEVEEYERNEHFLMNCLRQYVPEAGMPLHKEVNNYYPGSTQIRESGLPGAQFVVPDKRTGN